ncbi:MAG: class I SAM-dependent methyltransferase [Planctomycetota bacterium]
MTAASGEQAGIAAWFDATYRRLGFGYLRPPAAYPIYLQLLGAKSGDSLLDVACGPGLLLRAATERGVRAHGIDLAPTAVDMARRYAPDAQVAVGNSEALPWPTGTFDHVTCIGSLERMIDRRRVLAEVQRVARPDARFCFMVRNAQSLSWRVWRRGMRRQNHDGHQDAGTLAGWRALFAECGFVVDAVYPDQWLRQRVRSLWRGQPRPGRPEPVTRGVLPLRLALEFVFVLRRAESGT